MKLKMANVAVLNVLLYGEPIGTLTNVGGDRTLFAFNDDYIENPNRYVLGLRFKDELGELITEFKPTQTQVMPFFSNLLPEGHMRTYLADRADVKSEREFYLLWVLGEDLPGAVTIEPAEDEEWPPTNDDADGMDQKDRQEKAMRFSLAGVQLKFSAVLEASGGLTIPTSGKGGSWIVKLPSSTYAGVPENEYSMMTLARYVGIDVPAIELISTDEIENLPEGIGEVKGQALAIERFDRLSDKSLVHIEDFAQIFDVYPRKKYDKASARSIAKVIASEGKDSDYIEFIRRLTFNVLIGNADMHLKNWSIIYSDRRTASIAPAYDFVSTIPYIPDEKAALNFSRTKRFDEFSEDELSHLAAKAMLSEKVVLDTARETVELFHDYWQNERSNLPLFDNVSASIDKHLKKIPIASIR
jgi:serine/threonine-protein kinase HipA